MEPKVDEQQSEQAEDSDHRSNSEKKGGEGEGSYGASI